MQIIYSETPATRDRPPVRDHCYSNMGPHFCTFVPTMKDHLSNKITFCGLMGWSFVTGFTVCMHIKKNYFCNNIESVQIKKALVCLWHLGTGYSKLVAYLETPQVIAFEVCSNKLSSDNIAL